ncbi:helix-hairpin-helix domain-containing protein [Flavobacteriaceae bacterium]|nr:helix-hairpin-helix domain-containing protein [Flavobacteriaceae bacterium]
MIGFPAIEVKTCGINSIEDFKRVTKASDSLMALLGPLFKFPDWVVKSKPAKAQKNSSLALSYKEKIDLNIATQTQLQEVRGIGPALSARIISYRLKLGGFSVDKQLLSVWGLSEGVVANVLGSFTVKTPKEIIQIAVNTASASDIATISGISYDLAKQIWEFRVLREKIVSLSELQKIEGMTTSKYALIELYLHVE